MDDKIKSTLELVLRAKRKEDRRRNDDIKTKKPNKKRKFPHLKRLDELMGQERSANFSCPATTVIYSLPDLTVHVGELI